MRTSTVYWRWVAATMIVLAATFIGVAGGLAASKDNYCLWTSSPMIVAYCLISGAVVALTLSISSVGFPGVHDLPQKALMDLLHQGNELHVRLHALGNERTESVDEFSSLITELDEWWKRVEAAVQPHHDQMLPVLRSEADRLGFVYGERGPEFNEHATWLDQRLRQLEKVALSG